MNGHSLIFLVSASQVEDCYERYRSGETWSAKFDLRYPIDQIALCADGALRLIGLIGSSTRIPNPP